MLLLLLLLLLLLPFQCKQTTDNSLSEKERKKKTLEFLHVTTFVYIISILGKIPVEHTKQKKAFRFEIEI